MTDEHFTNDIDNMTDPMLMLKLIVEHEKLFSDPYYSDVRRALMHNAERIVREHFRFNSNMTEVEE